MNDIFDQQQIAKKLEELDALKAKVEKLLSLSELGQDVKKELDEFMEMLKSKIEDGSIFTESRPLDPDDPEDAELVARLEQQMIENADRKLQ